MNSLLRKALYLLLIMVFIFSLFLVVPVYRQYRKAQQEVAELNKELDRCRAESLASYINFIKFRLRIQVCNVAC